MKLEAYCAHSGPKVIGPGNVKSTVTLMIQTEDNPGKFTKDKAACCLNLEHCAAEVIAACEPGKRYTITIEESVTPAPAAT